MEYTVRIAGTPCETRVSGGTLAEACALLGPPLELVCAAAETISRAIGYHG